MANKTINRPSTVGMAATQDDWSLIDALKCKTGLFKTGDLLREALRLYAKQQGVAK